MKPITLVVVGMGAVGSLYASRAKSEYTSLHCITRSETEFIQKNAISIRNPDESTVMFRPDYCYNSLNKINFYPDYIIIATKVLPSINLILSLIHI